jgi:hypothetical protein
MRLIPAPSTVEEPDFTGTGKFVRLELSPISTRMCGFVMEIPLQQRRTRDRK